MSIEGTAILVIFVAVLTAFTLIVRHLYRVMMKGKPEDRFSRWPDRVKSVLVFVFGQARVLAQPAGIGHFIIFWGFIFITLGTLENILSMIIPAFSYSRFIGADAAGIIVLLQDVFG
ncbi:hypothetical protein DRQ05_06060, partial [bacterium]